MNTKLTAALVAAAALSALSAPGALAGPVEAAAQAACKAERAALGKPTFRATYGKTAMRTCRAGHTADAREAVQNASQTCRAERASDPQGFKETHGTNRNGANAFGKCVAKTAKKELRDEVRATVNAAQACKAERREDPAAFRAKYGTNANGANAFGKCVARTKAGDDAPDEPDEPSEPDEPDEPSEPGDPDEPGEE